MRAPWWYLEILPGSQTLLLELFLFLFLIKWLFNVKHAKMQKRGPTLRTAFEIEKSKPCIVLWKGHHIPVFMSKPSAMEKLIIQEADGFKVMEMHWPRHLISRQRHHGFSTPCWHSMKDLRPVHHWEFWSPFWSLSNYLGGPGFTLGARPVQIRHYTVQCVDTFVLLTPSPTELAKFGLLFKLFPKVWFYWEFSCCTSQLHCLYSSLFITKFLNKISPFHLPQHKQRIHFLTLACIPFGASWHGLVVVQNLMEVLIYKNKLTQ